MKKIIMKKEFPEIEMELFSRTYPCYMLISLFVLDNTRPTKVSIEAHMYETELVNGEWLLKTKDN